jgi:hypothetical protein
LYSNVKLLIFQIHGRGKCCHSLTDCCNYSSTGFTDRTSWLNALSGLGLTESPPDPFDNPINPGSPITFDSGVISQGAGGITPNNVSTGVYTGTVDALSNSSSTFDTITWTFPTTTLAFGADWSSTSTGSGLQVTVDGVTTVFGDVAGFTGAGSFGFLGVIADNSFSSLVLSSADRTAVDEGFSADNLSFATPVPAPAFLPGILVVLVKFASERVRGLRQRRAKGELKEGEVG